MSSLLMRKVKNLSGAHSGAQRTDLGPCEGEYRTVRIVIEGSDE